MAMLKRSKNDEVTKVTLFEDVMTLVHQKCKTIPFPVKGMAQRSITEMAEGLFGSDESFEEKLTQFLKQYGKYLK